MLNVKMNLIKRDKYIWIFLFFNYFILNFLDMKTFGFVNNKEDYIFRLMFQQFFIVFTNIFLVSRLFNEKTINQLKGYMVIYVNDLKSEIRATYIIILLINVICLFLGQFMFSFTNYLYTGVKMFDLTLVNFTIVSVEIFISVFMTISLRLEFKKDIFVYAIYYSIIIITLIINNTYITIPLTIKILGEYYYSYGLGLWIGRLWMLIVLFIIFKYEVKKFNNYFYLY